MTVKELSKILKKLLRICKGIESGFEDIMYLKIIKVRDETDNFYKDGEYQLSIGRWD